MNRRPATYHGVLLLDKPGGITSHDAVDKVRRILGQKEVGHAGTLDPAAEGLLVILLGRATKTARFLTDLDKEYEAEIRLGLESSTYDREGLDPEAVPATVPDLNRADIEQVLAGFRGTITQAVPRYSAVHVEGERLYERSRRGEEVTAPERTVQIDGLELLEHEDNRISLRVVCGKGTYIRSLAHDIGRRIGCGGYLAALRRTRCGRFNLRDAYTFENLDSAREQARLNDLVMPIDRALGFSSVSVTPGFSRLVANGRRPRGRDISGLQGAFDSGDHVLLMDERGAVLAIATAIVPSGRLAADPSCEVLKYERVLA